MEVLGAVAATGQLIGTAVAILESISQLRDFLRHAPARYQGWRDELAVLGDTITSIRDDRALHTCQVSRIIKSMAPKITRLTELCAPYTSQPKQFRLISKLNRARKARAVESCILQNFQSLEHDKTTLILTISTLSRATSTEHREKGQNMQPSNGDQSTRVKKETNITFDMSDMDSNRDANGAVLPYRHSPDSHSRIGYNSNSAHSRSSTPDSTGSRALGPLYPSRNMSSQPLSSGQFVRFGNVRANGNQTIVGASHAYPSQRLEADFKDVDINGNNTSVGVWTDAAIAASQSHRDPKSTGKRSSGLASKPQESSPSLSSGASDTSSAMNTESTEEDSDKMDIDP
ncbi:hypothetical protein F4781DRAFT_400278 [Annulohypoxylon bovei var. microspora]|nr:hypothetical protein F4781DRAFT_400278 [Annulohypoxylon bovei var. microspora]